MEDFKIGFRYVVEDNLKEVALVVCEGNWVPVKQVAEAMGLGWYGGQADKAKNFHAEPKATTIGGRKPLCIHMDHLQAWLDSFKPNLWRLSDAKRAEHFIAHLVPTLARVLMYDPTASAAEATDSTIYVDRELSMHDIAVKHMTQVLGMLPRDANILAQSGVVYWKTSEIVYQSGFVIPGTVVERSIENKETWQELASLRKSGMRLKNLGEIEIEQGRPVNRSVGQEIVYPGPNNEILSILRTEKYSWEQKDVKPTELPAAPSQPVRLLQTAT